MSYFTVFLSLFLIAAGISETALGSCKHLKNGEPVHYYEDDSRTFLGSDSVTHKIHPRLMVKSNDFSKYNECLRIKSYGKDVWCPILVSQIKLTVVKINF